MQSHKFSKTSDKIERHKRYLESVRNGAHSSSHLDSQNEVIDIEVTDLLKDIDIISGFITTELRYTQDF